MTAPMRHLLFDFDGTLVDSSPGILHTLEICLADMGLKARVPLTGP